MAESRDRPSLPDFESVQELVDFFDTEDMGDFIEAMPEAEFHVDLQKRRYLVAIDEDLMKNLTRIAKERNVSAASLVDEWLRERTQAAA
jgi:hypothetical protein